MANSKGPAVKIDYDALEAGIKAAVEAAKEAAQDADDGGTCNFDAAAIFLKGAREDRVKAAAKAAGVHATKMAGGMWRGSYTLGTPEGGQGNRNTVQAIAMTKALESAGFEATTYYQMD